MRERILAERLTPGGMIHVVASRRELRPARNDGKLVLRGDFTDLRARLNAAGRVLKTLGKGA